MRDANGFGPARRFTLAAIAAAGLAATAFIPITAQAADALLSGSITSAAGEKLAGDHRLRQGRRRDHHHHRLHRRRRQLLFPAAAGRQVSGLGAGADLRDGEKRGRPLGRQAPGFQARHARGFRAAIARRSGHRVAARRDARRCAPEEPGAQRLHGLPHAELSVAAQVRCRGLERDHRPDEACQRLGRLSGPGPAPTGFSTSIRRSWRPIWRGRAGRARPR